MNENDLPYISILQGHMLQYIIDHFQFTCGLPNVVGAIDGMYILLVKKPSCCDITVLTKFYCV